ncbi:predicted protein [Histoplasma capsulatum H143]|uniref:Uncharacterized protein n=1 Tax=Ajellomyces capsulatus (strain H143) TaxID=544712 RepID=C6HRE9_AJECH|nr:predicted protein [Histoplasma capsulatum H143]
MTIRRPWRSDRYDTPRDPTIAPPTREIMALVTLAPSQGTSIRGSEFILGNTRRDDTAIVAKKKGTQSSKCAANRHQNTDPILSHWMNCWKGYPSRVNIGFQHHAGFDSGPWPGSQCKLFETGLWGCEG